MSYYQFRDDHGNGYGSCEIFHMSEAEIRFNCWFTANDGRIMYALPLDGPRDLAEDPADLAGFYWRPCFPGCIPDGDPIGPFETEGEAMADAGVIA